MFSKADWEKNPIILYVYDCVKMSVLKIAYLEI